MSTQQTVNGLFDMLGHKPESSGIMDRVFKPKPSPLVMLCDLHADGRCDSLGSDFCERECPNRARVTAPITLT